MIEIEGLRFGCGRKALYEGFDLRVDSPGLYGLFGRNGSGKSTLLKLLAGLLFPRGGRIRVSGHEPRLRHPDFLAGVTIVPEEFHLPNLSCERFVRHHAGFYPRFDRAVLDEALATFEVDSRAPFDSMSLGSRKKAVLAFALATRTPLLLLDEPTNGLDIVERDRFRDLIRRPEQADRIVLISTHQVHDVDQAALARVDGVVYQEAIGAQAAFIATRNDDVIEPVQLELLYRALCRAPETVVATLPAKEVSHV